MALPPRPPTSGPPPSKTVRVFWLKPTDVAYDQRYPDGIANVMREAQRYYKQELGKTFTLNNPVVEVVNGEHDTQVAQGVHGSVPVVSGDRGREKSRKLESALAVRRAHHGDLDLLAAQSGDTPRPLSVHRRLSLELEPELAKELDCRRQILNDDADVVHT